MEWSDGVTDNPRSITVEDGKNVSITAVFKNSGDTTGIENHTSEIINHKFLKEGILYIELNGKTYNAQGQIAK